MRRDEIVTQGELSREWRELLDAAQQARARAYAPYSSFPVGAAVRTATGRIYAGCNVENASSGLTVCAERVAIWKAISEGERDFVALAVVTESGSPPCGACRQVMSEFVEDMPVLVADTSGQAWLTTLQHLLPDAFPRVSLADGPAGPPGK